jgi:hypothetical protein
VKNREAQRERYLADALPVRLAGLAADLGRVASSRIRGHITSCARPPRSSSGPRCSFSGGKDSIVMAWLAAARLLPGSSPSRCSTSTPATTSRRPWTTATGWCRTSARSSSWPRAGVHRQRPRAGGKRPQRQPQQAADRDPARRHRASTSSTPASAVAAATKRRPAPRSASSPTATASASGTPRTSAPSSGTSSTAASISASTSASSR